jgi:hypothetical protein
MVTITAALWHRTVLSAHIPPQSLVDRCPEEVSVATWIVRPYALIVLALMVLIMRFANPDRCKRRIRFDDLSSAGQTLVLRVPSSRRAHEKYRVINEI